MTNDQAHGKQHTYIEVIKGYYFLNYTKLYGGRMMLKEDVRNWFHDRMCDVEYRPGLIWESPK